MPVTSPIWKRILAIGRSMTFAVILLGVMAVAALVGVMMEDQERAKDLIYNAWWFQGILVFLVLDLVLAVVVHAEKSWRYAAYFLTHAGMIATLVGFAVSHYFGTQGYLELDVGKHTGQLHNLNPRTNRLEPQEGKKLPFEVFLEKFYIDHYPSRAPYVVATMRDTKKDVRVRLDQGDDLRSPDPRYQLFAEERLAKAKRKYNVVNRSDKLRSPAVKVRGDLNGHGFEGWLFAAISAVPLSESPLVVMDFKYGVEPAAWQEAIRETQAKLRTSLTFEDELTKVSGSVPVVFNRDQPLGKTGISIRILRAISGVKVDIESKKTEELTGPPQNPALRVELRGANGLKYERYVFSEPPPPTMEQRLRGEFPSLKLGYEWRPALGKDFAYAMVHSADGRNVSITALQPEGKPSTGTVTVGGGKPFAAGPVTIQADEFYPDAMVEAKVEPVEAGGEPALRLRVEGPLGKDTQWMMLNAEQPVIYPDRNLAVRYVQDPPAIQNYNSTLRFLEGMDRAGGGTVSVNHPVTHREFTFYQIDYDKEEGKWSVVKAVSSPGAPVLYAGFAMLMVGVVGMVLSRPKGKHELGVEDAEPSPGR